MSETKPRPGWRTSLYMETVDPEGLKVSDTTQNWYGKADPESNLKHNTLATDIIDAVSNQAKLWATEKAIAEGVDPGDIEAHHAIRSEIMKRVTEGQAK